MLPAKIIIGKSPVSTNADGLISLTDLYEAKAASQSSLLGRLSVPAPDEWTRKADVGQRMLRVADEIGVHPSEVLKREGVNMYAHLVIALDYARFIDLEVEVVEDKPEPTTQARPTKLLIGDKPVATIGVGLISLTDLWKAGGQRHHEKPTLWLQKVETRQFLETVEEKLKVSKDALLKSSKGRHTGGTYAHWQIALAYAKYLSPELHMAVNEVFMRYKAGDPTLAEEVIDKVEDPAREESKARKRVEEEKARDEAPEVEPEGEGTRPQKNRGHDETPSDSKGKSVGVDRSAKSDTPKKPTPKAKKSTPSTPEQAAKEALWKFQAAISPTEGRRRVA